MSKRVSNKTGRGRKTYARSAVKYGWRKMQLFAIHGRRNVLSGKYLTEDFK